MMQKLDEYQILKRIIELERGMGPEDLGFEWFTVPAQPSILNRMVLEGVLKVNFKSHSSTNYRLGVPVDEAERMLVEEKPAEVEEPVKIPEDLFDTIIGHADVVDLFKRALRVEKQIHFLMLGDVATAKSLFLEELSRLPGAELVLGGRATKVGISDVLLDRRPKILLIDEMDKCDRGDLSILLSLCQSGLVKETKHNSTRQVKLDTKVFAAANTTRGIPPEMLSRFEILRFRRYSDEEAREVMVGTLTKREGVDMELAGHTARKVIGELGSRDPRAATRIARLAKTREEVNEVVAIVKRRSLGYEFKA